MRVLAAAVILATATSGAYAKDEKPDKAQKICKTVQVTGSRMPKRTCKTEQQWKTDAERSTGEDLAVKNDQYREDNSVSLGPN